MYSVRDNAKCAGLPHSEIFGSKVALTSPKLIAECHVFHRLSMPRHPPIALTTLEILSIRRDKKERYYQR
jgi:hypothetical protein